MTEINVLTGEVIKKRDDSTYYDPFTQTFKKCRDEDGLVHNNITGSYDPVPDDEPVEKGSRWPSLSGESDDEDDDEEFEKGGRFEKNVPLFIDVEKADQRICYGVVYEPDEVDAQGDQASAAEIKKAAYHFMENSQQFKVMHKGKAAAIKVLESYIAPTDLVIAKKTIKKGSWVVAVRVNDKQVWKDIKAGKLTGFSMAGYAKIDEAA